MIIKKKLERLVNLGHFENVKVGVELEKEVKASGFEDVKKAGIVIGKLAKSIIDEEVKQIKEEEAAKKPEQTEEIKNGEEKQG